jgi:hypothetical protein
MKYLTLPLVALLAASTNAAVVFTENFESAAVDDSFSSIGWVAYRDARDSASFTDTSTTTNEGSLLSTTSPLAGSRSGFLSADPLSGGSNGGAGQFYAGRDVSVAITNATSYDFTYSADSGSSSTDLQIVRLAIEIDDTNWYVAESPFASATNSSVSFSFAGANWIGWEDPSDGFDNAAALATTGGSTIGSGNITSIGLVLASNRRTPDFVRFDDVTFNAVPEPSTYALMAGTLVLGLAVHRRRRN